MDDFLTRQPATRAVSVALRDARDPSARSDLLFLEAWEMQRAGDLGATLRAGQIRRANPDLAAAIERELKAANDTRHRAGKDGRHDGRVGSTVKPNGNTIA